MTANGVLTRDWARPEGTTASATVLGRFPTKTGGREARDCAAVGIHAKLLGKCSYALGFVYVEEDETLWGFTVYLIDGRISAEEARGIVVECLIAHHFHIVEACYASAYSRPCVAALTDRADIAALLHGTRDATAHG